MHYSAVDQSGVEISVVNRYQGKSLGFSRQNFPQRVIDIIKTLDAKGYESYIVGGGVRDFLLGANPKDFDVATDAHPEQVVKLFRRCRVIGKRFRIVHVRDRREMTEVATFRAFLGESKDSIVKGGRIIQDNTYGSLEEDILRRDFTVNAMYYNPLSDELVCHKHAMSDIENRYLRSIGNPWVRYREDPVRMLRAIRFTAKLGLQMDEAVSQNIYTLASLIKDVPPARLFEESIKIFHSGAALEMYVLLKKYGIFSMLYPRAGQRICESENGELSEKFLKALLKNTDARISVGKPVTPAFILAALLWLSAEHLHLQAENKGVPLSWYESLSEAWSQQRQHVSAPRNLIEVAREICLLQRHLESHRKKHLQFVANHSRFRAAYDFLCLRADSGLSDPEQAVWWTQFQEVNGAERRQMMRERSSGSKQKKRKKS